MFKSEIYCYEYKYCIIFCFVSCDHLRDVSWDDFFKFSASASACEFCEQAQAGIDVYIPHRKY